MSVNQIVPLLNVEDMTVSTTFYVDGLGFEITREWRPDGELQWCQLQRDGIGIMIQHTQGATTPSKAMASRFAYSAMMRWRSIASSLPEASPSTSRSSEMVCG